MSDSTSNDERQAGTSQVSALRPAREPSSRAGAGKAVLAGAVQSSMAKMQADLLGAGVGKAVLAGAVQSSMAKMQADLLGAGMGKAVLAGWQVDQAAINAQMARSLNLQLGRAGLFPRVAPTAVALVNNDLRAAVEEAIDEVDGWSEEERRLARPVVQMVVTVVVCAHLAKLGLSENEIVRFILQLLGPMSLAASGIPVWKLTGQIFDLIYPPTRMT